jgi:hypothetical protein
MKKITKPAKPKSFKISTLANYLDLRGSDGKIKQRWNHSNQDILNFRVFFREIFDLECAYCGIRVDREEIDHFLPKSKFPYLSYCYDNYIFSCHTCNQKKGDFYPKILENINYGEKILLGEIEGIIEFNKKSILSKAIDNRLIEPTFDKIEDHLAFNVLTCEYTAKTKAGEFTKVKFFDINFSAKMAELSDCVSNLVVIGLTIDSVLETYKVLGYSFYIKKMFYYWKEFYS